MPVFDTSNTIDTSVYMKAKLPKNRVGDNYYLENLQHKRDQVWYMRYNVVDIEEELDKQCVYSKEQPNYTPIEVAIRNVKDDKGQDLSTDWANIAFRDLQHSNKIGDRYRFSLDFPDMSAMSEEDKYYNTSVWICINKNELQAGNDCVIRRCNGSLAFVGSPTLSYDNITEVHYEPVVLENELKYISFYYNMTTVVPQGEWYATMQLNYYTNAIKVNDRVIIGGVDTIDKNNNSVYKVKAIVKTNSQNTFARDGSTEVENIPLCIIALDKDTIDRSGGGDDFTTRVAEQAPIYLVDNSYPTYQYYITLQNIDMEGTDSSYDDSITTGVADFVKPPYNKRILLGETEFYEINLMFNDNVVIPAMNELKTLFSVTSRLAWINYDDEGKEYISDEIIDNEGEYYELEIIDRQGCRFSIRNKKTFNKGILLVDVECLKPDGNKFDTDEDNQGNTVKEQFEFELGGFY